MYGCALVYDWTITIRTSVNGFAKRLLTENWIGGDAVAVLWNARASLKIHSTIRQSNRKPYMSASYLENISRKVFVPRLRVAGQCLIDSWTHFFNQRQA